MLHQIQQSVLNGSVAARVVVAVAVASIIFFVSTKEFGAELLVLLSEKVELTVPTQEFNTTIVATNPLVIREGLRSVNIYARNPVELCRLEPEQLEKIVFPSAREVTNEIINLTERSDGGVAFSFFDHERRPARVNLRAYVTSVIEKEMVQTYIQECVFSGRRTGFYLINPAFAQTVGQARSTDGVLNKLGAVGDQETYYLIARLICIAGAMLGFAAAGLSYLFFAKDAEQRKRSFGVSSYLGTFLMGALFG